MYIVLENVNIELSAFYMDIYIYIYIYIYTYTV